MRDHVGHIITAVVAVLVAGISALALWGTTNATLDSEQQRVDQAENERARGSARVLANELLLASSEMRDLGVDGYFRKFDESYKVELPADDLRLVATRLGSDEWRQVALALAQVESLERYLRNRTVPHRVFGATPLTENALQLISRDMDQIGAAVLALGGLGEVELAYPTLDAAAAWEQVKHEKQRYYSAR